LDDGQSAKPHLERVDTSPRLVRVGPAGLLVAVAIKRLAAAKGDDASEWRRAIIETQVRRDLAAIQLRAQVLAAKPGSLTEEEPLKLADEAKRATRPR
jgi:hypothetical protein